MSKKGKGTVMGPAMTYQIPHPAGAVKIETFVPWKFIRRGIKRQVILGTEAPASHSNSLVPPRHLVKESPLLRALGLAHYWQMLLDTQKVADVFEIAEKERIDVTQVRRLIRLTLLNPQYIESLALDIPRSTSLDWILRQTLSVDWVVQNRQLQASKM